MEGLEIVRALNKLTGGTTFTASLMGVSEQAVYGWLRGESMAESSLQFATRLFVEATLRHRAIKSWLEANPAHVVATVQYGKVSRRDTPPPPAGRSGRLLLATLKTRKHMGDAFLPFGSALVFAHWDGRGLVGQIMAPVDDDRAIAKARMLFVP
jgi:hypothetical protein